ncbi:hypothetical protein CYLTODRAFT_435920 [Cylindrobasidium torrendii FP15055 ss-10]|uniref:MICOS complex subunit n=1 Tax=Cylindrobasidium torrendii FP15055 ss-10 TaxID=1314674 RepID=A0A0D7BHL2_9AGAR|nr:hypothetical protein CYLTODRAFT_435920 [Cylindrobasidium torrendii FP15055 ss-10]
MLSPIIMRRSASAVMAATGLVLVNEQKEKLPIYPTPPPDLILIDSPSALEHHIGEARRQLRDAYKGTHAEVQGVVDKWIGVERKVEDRIKSLLPPTEPLTPGALYIGIATLSSSILTRSRPSSLRILLPPLLFLSSSAYFLPQTSANVRAYLGEVEEHYLPEVARRHEVGKKHAVMGWERVKEGVEGGRERVGGVVEGVVGGVERGTGLKVREALGWGVGKNSGGKEGVVVVEKDLKEKEDK